MHDEPSLQTLQVNGIRMRIASQGSGPFEPDGLAVPPAGASTRNPRTLQVRANDCFAIMRPTL